MTSITLLTALGCAGPELEESAAAGDSSDGELYRVRLESAVLDPAELETTGVVDPDVWATLSGVARRHDIARSGRLGGWRSHMEYRTEVSPGVRPSWTAEGFITTASLLEAGLSADFYEDQIYEEDGRRYDGMPLSSCGFEISREQIPAAGAARMEISADSCRVSPFWDTPLRSRFLAHLESLTVVIEPVSLAAQYDVVLADTRISDYLKEAWDPFPSPAPEPRVTVTLGDVEVQSGRRLNQWSTEWNLAVVEAAFPTAITETPMTVTVEDCDGLTGCGESELMVQCTFLINPVDLAAGDAYLSTTTCQEYDEYDRLLEDFDADAPGAEAIADEAYRYYDMVQHLESLKLTFR